METYNEDTRTTDQNTSGTPRDPHRTGRIVGGLFIVVIGLLLLARQAGMEIPRWLFSFESILIGIGIYLGIRHSFRGFVWIIPILIGGFLLLDDFYPEYDIEDFVWPLIIIGIGLLIMFQAGKRRGNKYRGNDPAETYTQTTGDDLLDSTVVFGGVKKNIISKNFHGGEAVTVFGGTEINLMQSDLVEPAILELTQVFGGTKLIVPPHWKVSSKDMVAILGGIDDKRPLLGNAAAEDSNKVLILKGTCLLGGIEIRSY